MFTDVNKVKPATNSVPGLFSAFFQGFYYSAMKEWSVLMRRTMLELNLSNCLPQGSRRVRILSNGRYLQINNADLSDTASYTCVASNIAGKTTREFLLTVHGKIMDPVVCVLIFAWCLCRSLNGKKEAVGVSF